MSIPLDQIYNYIEKINNEIYNDCILIYHFWPHGSKKIQDLTGLHSHYKSLDQFTKIQYANMIMHDQEPLKFDQYQGTDILQHICDVSTDPSTLRPFNWPITENTSPQELALIEIYKNLNLRFAISNPFSVFDLTMLVHSEKNSVELKIYEDNGFIGVYWWCHAIIALDWFRYLQHVDQKKKAKKTFLIYNRAWSGTREYRLKFAEFLIRLGIEDHCQTNVNPVEPELGIHYEQHTFSNPTWRPSVVLENHFPTTAANSWASADIALGDYEATDIEVVLETLFDDPRQQLTEKSLRPIACAQPFILASTPGSLEYLRNYGFKTFGDLWDESYDTTVDPEKRLHAIVDLMNQIRHWLPHVRESKMTQAQAIADYNKKLFFSKEWQENIINEYKNNFSDAMKIMTANITSAHTKKLQKLKPDSVVSDEQKENRRKIFEAADIVRKQFTVGSS
jgi:hypothetical protein